MAQDGMLAEARRRFIALLESEPYGRIDLEEEMVFSRPLSLMESLGNPGRDDFPLLRGKEVLMQATYKGCAGQAFTSAIGEFRGSLGEVLEMSLDGSFERAIFISTMNAVLGHLGLVEGTVHCRDDGPNRCAGRIPGWIKEQNADCVGLVGLQPAILEALVNSLSPDRVMVLDLAEAGSVRLGIRVLDGASSSSSEIFELCDPVLITGSSAVNGTIDGLYESALSHGKRAVFYGTTVAGIAQLLGLQRWCPFSSSCKRN